METSLRAALDRGGLSVEILPLPVDATIDRVDQVALASVRRASDDRLTEPVR